MRDGTLDAVLRQIKKLAAAKVKKDLSDAELLERFQVQREEAAFALLVQRHGPMVLGVCRRVLGNVHDAEDAFQATFLVLATRAASIRKQHSIGSWLHGVARRVALKERARTLRKGAHKIHSKQMPHADPLDDITWQELRSVLDEELALLPEKYRAAVVLCYFEGKTNEQAARELACPKGSISWRLGKARDLLRARLQRRGVALSAGALATVLTGEMASAGVPAGLMIATVSSAAQYVAGSTGAVSASVLALTQGTVKAMSLNKITFAVVLAVAMAGVGGVVALRAPVRLPGAVAEGAPKADEQRAPKTDAARPLKDTIGDPLPEAALLRLGAQRFRHPNSATGLALSPDGKTVMTLGSNGLYAWDTATGQERWHADSSELQRGFNPGVGVGVSRLVFWPDSKSCITLGNELTFTTWDVATGKATTTSLAIAGKVPQAYFSSVDISGDGKTLALGGPAGIFLCDRAGNVLARIANRPQGPLNDTPGAAPKEGRLLAWDHFSYGRFSPDGKTLAVAASEAPEVVKICQAADGSVLRRLQLSKRYLDSAFSPDGKLLAVAERDDAVRVYEIETGKRLHSWKLTLRGVNENYIFNVLFSPDGKTVVASSSDKLIRIWDVTSGAEVGHLKGHVWYPWGLAFTADGKVLYSTGWDGDIRRWDLATRKQLPLPVGIRGSSVVAAAPDGRSVVYVDGNDNLRFVDAKSGQEVRKVDALDMATSQIAFAPDGRSLALGGTNGDNVVTCLLDVTSGKATRRWEWPKGRDPHAKVEELAFTTDGRRLAAAIFRQGQARVWDLHDKEKPLLLAHEYVNSLSFSPDGKTLVTAGWDKKLRFWDPTNGTLRKEFLVAPPNRNVPGARDNLDDTRIRAVAFSPDGSRIAAADMNDLLWLWDADSLQVKFLVHMGDIFSYNCLAFSPDGLWLATGGRNGKVKVWDAFTGQLVWDRGAHAGNLYKVSFGRDSRRLLSGADDGLGYLWDLRPKDLPTKKPEALWNDLVGADGPAAYGSFWALLDQPETAITLLAERGNQLLAKVRSERIEKWIGELDDDKSATREAAMKELTQHLQTAVPLLRKELAKTRSLEQQKRLERLLEQVDPLRSRAELMIVSVLAHLDTPAARRLLSHWAVTDSDGPVGRAAAALVKQGP